MTRRRLLTRAEEADYTRRIQAGDNEAADEFLRLNEGLARKGAMRYGGSYLPFDDRLQLARMGLLEAAKRFDPAKGHKFSTYATWWVRQHVVRGTHETARTIRYPHKAHDELYADGQARAHLHAELNRDPTDEEVADALGMTPDRYEKRIGRLRRQWVNSLDEPIGDDGTTTLGEMLPAVTPDPDAALERDRLRRLIARAFGVLTTQEQAVVAGHLVEGQTLAEVGEAMGFTRQRAGQVKEIALAKLRQVLERRGQAHLGEVWGAEAWLSLAEDARDVVA